MPDMDVSKRPDLSDIADDDIRSLKDDELRDVLYRVTQKLKQILEYQENQITTLYDAVSSIEDELSSGV